MKFQLLVVNIIVLSALLWWWAYPSYKQMATVRKTILKPTSVSTPTSDFELISVLYEPINGGKGIDVSKEIKVDKMGKITKPFLCCSLFKDPARLLSAEAPNEKKRLSFNYKRNGKNYKLLINENEKVEGTFP